MRNLHIVWVLSAVLCVDATRSGHTHRIAAQTRVADTVRVAVDAASARDDWTALEDARALAERLLATQPKDALLQHYHGYARFRLALIASRRHDAAVTHKLLADADRALASSEATLALAETHALRASVLGQMIGLTKNPLVAMRLGPRSGTEMRRALDLAPTNPRVCFIRGLNTMYTPKLWGGGLEPAEAYLLKARELVPTDTAHAPFPTWGSADIDIALGRLHLMQHRFDAARTDFGRALVLQPENAWLRDTLMVETTRKEHGQ